MKTKRYSPSQIVDKLRRVEALTANGATVGEAVKQIGVTDQTYYRWKNKYGTMEKADVQRLKELERENARLKKLVADLTLDKDILKEALSGKF